MERTLRPLAGPYTESPVMTTPNTPVSTKPADVMAEIENAIKFYGDIQYERGPGEVPGSFAESQRRLKRALECVEKHLATPAPAVPLGGGEVPKAALKDLMRGYVNLLETGRDRILQAGGQCDTVEQMEAADPYLRAARSALQAQDAAPVADNLQKLADLNHELGLESVTGNPTAEHWLEKAHVAMSALRELVECKDLKDAIDETDASQFEGVDAKQHEYNRRKPLAWAAARAVLAGGVPECENCKQLVRALRAEIDPPTLMGEPVSAIPPAGVQGDAARLDFVEKNCILILDSVTKQPGGNGGLHVAPTREAIDAAISAQSGVKGGE